MPLRATAMLGTGRCARIAAVVVDPDAGRGAVDRRPWCARSRATWLSRVIVADGGSRDATALRAHEARAPR